MRRGALVAILAVLAGAAPAGAAAPPPMLSAFFGIDNGLPAAATLLCPPAVLLDGMPVVFRDEVDERTLWPSQFEVTTAAGRRWRPVCATTAPANQESEDRTVLLIGELGSASADPPQRVTVVGDLRTESGASLRGASAPVVALRDGPTLVFAEPAPAEDETFTYAPLTPSVLSALQRASACPPGTAQRVRVTWDGGVTAPGGADDAESERTAYSVALQDGSAVVPAALADLGDMDNNHLLCLDTATPAVAVTAQAGRFQDPAADLNPATGVRLSVPG